MLVTLTETAADKVKELSAGEPDGEAEVLRIAIQGGGCSGFQYELGFDAAARDGDHHIEAHGVTIVVDPFSAPYLAGTEIDFVDALQGAGFAINNPNVEAACGCGSSFQARDDIDAEPVPAAAAGCDGCAAA